jgi:protocatechuate 3,4-dioxygenase beta subunit
MQDLTVTSVTDAVVAQMADTPDPRLRQIMASLVRHMHDFARDVTLTPEEWLKAIGFLTQVGQACTPARQEFILLSDVLGLSALVNLLHDKTATEIGTESSLLGPFYQQNAPFFALGESIAVKAKGPELQLYGQVTDKQGKPVPHAVIQVWQTDAEGSYDLQLYHGNEMDMRGNFRADAEGRFHFRTVRPLGYMIPIDGPVGALIGAQQRHGYRPAHIHFLIGAPGYRELVTALYLGGGSAYRIGHRVRCIPLAGREPGCRRCRGADQGHSRYPLRFPPGRASRRRHWPGRRRSCPVHICRIRQLIPARRH